MTKGRFATLSMTGFGCASVANKSVRVDVEIKTLNNRFLDVITRLPRCYSSFEADLKSLVTRYLERGRIEISVQRQPLKKEAAAVQLNQALFCSYYESYQQVAKESGVSGSDFKTRAVIDILNRRDVLELTEQLDHSRLERSVLLQAVEQALQQVVKMRAVEGNQLAKELLKRLRKLQGFRKQLSKELPPNPKKLQKRLTERLQLLKPEIKVDPERLAVELAILADRVDVTEELVRLESHFTQFEEALALAGTGRKLEFLTQELGREFNTIGSKAQNAFAQQLVVEAKAEMEKIREQLQNVA